MRTIAVLQLLVVSLVAGLPDCRAAAPPPLWRLTARPAWVLDAPPDAGSSPAPGAGVLLHDRQIRLTAAGDDRYEHTIERLSRARTGEYTAQVSVSVDPRYQALEIHTLRLTHAGAPPAVFTAAQIGALLRSQPVEPDAQHRDLNPRLQISIQLSDAQAGDLLETEYTVHSQTARFPGLLGGHYAALWPSGGDQPVRLERLRVIWPPGRNLQYRVSSGAAGAAPQVHLQEGELRLQWRDLVPVTEADTPRWFDRQSTVQLSDFNDWRQVAALLAPQYAAATSSTSPATHPTPEMILEALRLVQSKVQLTHGAGNGPYVPADPDAVLQRGYGDSRDLARLLCSLLQRLGAEAHVALADSRRGALLDTSLPSPYGLDSALVLTRVGATEYLLNPAAAGPAAVLDTTDTADLRHALIVTATDGKVVALPPAPADSRLRVVTQQFDLRAGSAQPATLRVTTQFHGGWARAVSADLHAQSPAQLQLTQIQGVARDFPNATPEGAVQLREPAGGQLVQLTAQFQIPQVFGDPQDPHIDLFAESLAEAVEPRDEATRQFPLSLPWPFKLEEHIEAALPPGWVVLPGTTVIETAAFRYQREVRFTRGRLSILHSYVSRSDHVDPGQYPAFVQANAQVYQALGLQLRPPQSAWQRLLQWLGEHALMLVAALTVLATLGGGLWRRWRRD